MYRYLTSAVVVACVVCSFSFAEEKAPKKTKKLTGQITVKGEAKFTPEMVAEVRLLDVSLADAPARTLGIQKIKNLKKTPIPFDIEYDPVAIKPGRRYSVGIRITAKGKLHYINDTRFAVLTNGNPSKDVKVFVIPVKR